MPMPDGGHWPPLPWAHAYQAYREWNAWYTGEPDLLTEVYTNRRDVPYTPRVRTSQYQGGVFGRAARWLWGDPPREDSKDPRVHIPAPADLARVSADLMFSEPPTLSLPKHMQPPPEVPDAPVPGEPAKADTAPKRAAATPTEERLAALGQEMAELLLEGAETAAALGDTYLRVTVDREVCPDRAFLTRVDADGALPQYRNGFLVEVTFWTLLECDGTKYVRLLEHHTRGRIEYGLYVGSDTELGRRVPLTEHADAAYLTELVDGDSGQDTGLKDKLAVVLWPNIGPQRRWRTVPHLRNLGRSDFDGIEPLFNALDVVWSSWMRDIDLGRGRVIVPDVYLSSLGAGNGAYFDQGREYFVGLNMLPKPGGESQMLTISQFEIRVEQHRDTADAIWREILKAPRYSEQTFGEQGDGGAAVTATEVSANQKTSFTTRDRKLMIAKRVIADAVELILAVEKALNLPAARGVEVIRPEVVPGEVVSPDPLTTAETSQLLKAAGAASTYTLVEMNHPGWDKEQIDAEVMRIEGDLQAQAERDAPPMLEDPDEFRGGGSDDGDG